MHLNRTKITGLSVFANLIYKELFNLLRKTEITICYRGKIASAFGLSQQVLIQRKNLHLPGDWECGGQWRYNITPFNCGGHVLFEYLRSGPFRGVFCFDKTHA